jgi:hypothetical protein
MGCGFSDVRFTWMICVRAPQNNNHSEARLGQGAPLPFQHLSGASSRPPLNAAEPAHSKAIHAVPCLQSGVHPCQEPE